MESEHTIIIRRAGAFYSVCIEPPHPDMEARVFGDQHSARGWAGGIRMTTGWPKRDFSEEKSNA